MKLALERRLAVAFSLFLSIANLAAAQDLSTLTFLPGDDVLAPAAGLQEEPAVAAGGSGYLAVWSDARSSAVSLPAFTAGPYFSPGIGTMRDIYAARLDAAGNLVDTTPIIVEQAVLNQGFPSVAWNGQNWLVVWMGQAGMACCPDIHIYAARISPTGLVLDDPPIVVDTDATSSGLYWPDVVSDGTNWAVVWRDLDQQAGIFTLDGARISADGIVLDQGGKRLRRDLYNSYPTWPSIAFAGDEFLLVWNEDSNEIAAQRLDLALNRVGDVFRVNLLGGSSGQRPCVASDGATFFVTWFESRWYGWAQLYGARVSHAGAVLDPSGITLTPTSGYTQFTPCVVWDGSQWIVGYNIQKNGLNDDLYATRVATTGAVLDPSGIAIMQASTTEGSTSIAPAPGGGAMLVWQSIRTAAASGDIYAGKITGGGTTGGAACVSLGAPRQTQPELAWNGGGYLAVFRSETSLVSRLVGQRLDGAGAPLDAEPFVITSGDGDAGFSGPAVAWDGSRYLVTWSTAQSVVRARRFTVDGSPLDAETIEVMPGNEPDVAAFDGVFLVVATHAPNHPHFRHPFSVRIQGADGAKLDVAPVVIGSYFASNPNVRALGGRWLAAWQQNPTHDNVRADIYANFVGAGGTPGTSFAMTSTGVTIEEDPFISVGANTALVGWTNGDLLGRRVLADGTLLDATPRVLSSANGAQIEPEGDWNGAEHVVIFTDQRNDNPNGPYIGDVYGARVSGSGIVGDEDGFAIANTPDVPELHPAVAGASGQAALGCAAFVPAAPISAYRIGVRILKPLGTIDTEPPLESALLTTLDATPNPFAESIMFSFHVANEGMVSARIYDARGRIVRTIEAQRFSPGVAQLSWDGRDTLGRRPAPGIYFVRIGTRDGTRVAKIVRR